MVNINKQPADIRINLNEVQLISIIKDLLSLNNENTWTHETVSKKLEIKFRGNHWSVMEVILDWLDVPERRFNIMMSARRNNLKCTK